MHDDQQTIRSARFPRPPLSKAREIAISWKLEHRLRSVTILGRLWSVIGCVRPMFTAVEIECMAKVEDFLPEDLLDAVGLP